MQQQERKFSMENTITQEAKKTYSKIGLILFLTAVLIFFLQSLLSMVVNYTPALYNNSSLSFLIMMSPIYIIVFPLAFFIFRKIPVTETSPKAGMTLRQWLAAFFVSVAVFYVSNIVGLLITFLIGLIKGNAVQNNMLNIITNSSNIYITILIIVILAPVFEEFLFRKCFLDRVGKYGEKLAVFVSALTFALYHGNLNQFVYAFSLGLIFGFIYIRTRKIQYTIFLHIGINFVGSILGPLVIKLSGCLELIESLGPDVSESELMSLMMENITGLLIYYGYMFVLFASVIAGIVILLVNLKKIRLPKKETDIEKGKGLKTALLNVGMILNCIFWSGFIIYNTLM